jgi:NADPH:quinone reductase-like Zn-dependent oxidoreductase
MMGAHNQAAWISEKSATMVVADAEYPEVLEDSVIIKNAAVALNPLDFKMQDYGLMVKAWPTITGQLFLHPTHSYWPHVGCDVAGEIVAVGKDVIHLRKGQRVIGLAVCLITGDLREAGFQLYTSVPANLVSVIPDDLSFTAAAVLPLSVACAVAGLYEQRGLRLPLPSGSPPLERRMLLVWGGSSSVGGSTIQLARASGVDVVATASPHNFGVVQKLGASAVFDYADPDIILKLVTFLKDTRCIGAYDSTGTNFSQCGTVIEQLGGGHVAGTLVPPSSLPAGVTANHGTCRTVEPWQATLTSTVYATSIKDNHLGAAIFNNYLPEALTSGTFTPYPPSLVVGNGLDELQSAMLRLKQGMSATKLVVTLHLEDP